jgi:tyrosine-protein phosphatase YwqE
MLGYYSNEVKNNAEMLIKKEMISFVGTDCHNMNHARLYSKCQTLSAWHDLVKSQKLLNSQL